MFDRKLIVFPKKRISLGSKRIVNNMADLKDERGNPIHLTDAYGNPVQLSDEFGNPMHITGVASTAPQYKDSVTGNIAEYPTEAPPAGVAAGTGAAATTAAGVTTSETTTGQQHHGSLGEHLRRSGSSSSSSSVRFLCIYVVFLI